MRHDQSGGFMVVWQSFGQDGALEGIYARRYQRLGAPIGDDFRVSSWTASYQRTPSLAIGKNVVVAWKSHAQDGSFTGVFGQVYRGPCRSSDQNGDGTLTVNDVFYLINHLFAGSIAPVCGGDVNGDKGVDVTDVFYLINYLFAGGPPPI